MASPSPSKWSELKSEALVKCFLPLSSDNHKGSSGRIGVLGGSAQYTGAPYYAGMAALQAGADLVYIFCAQEAALAIKSYSPELMVAPVYAAERFDAALDVGTNEQQNALVDSMVERVVSYMERLHVLVMGPGLGRCPLVFQATARIIQEAMQRKITIVLDADALFLLTLDVYKEILTDYDRFVLTPNLMEYNRLLQAHGDEQMKLLSKGLIVKKGACDLIFRLGSDLLVCSEDGGLKRSGGLGDILAGTLATFMGWHDILQSRGCEVDRQLSCWSACWVTKRATHSAFRSKRRAMTAPDVLNEIGPAMMEMENDTEHKDSNR
jgi:ATP-dependent NAD(P)H-hydrate dehydratase